MTAATLHRVRWPLAPLLDAAGHPPVHDLATRVGVTSRTVWRWHHTGLTDTQADHAAIALGYHPANIWIEWHNP